MKNIRIKDGNIGLVFKNENYKRVIQSGKHRLSWGEEVQIFDATDEFFPPVDLSFLLKDLQLNRLLSVNEISDNELLLISEKGKILEVRDEGTVVFWNTVRDLSFQKIDCTNCKTAMELTPSTIQNPLLNAYVRLIEVEVFEKGILIIEGKEPEVLSSGQYFFWRNFQKISINKVDMRKQLLEVSGQELLTKDKANIRMNAFASFQVVDPKVAILENVAFKNQLYTLLQLALRSFVGGFTIDELLEKKNEVASAVLDEVMAKAASLGVSLNEFGIRDIILPGEMKEIMNQVLIATKKAQANVITRREETASTRSLLNTAKLMEDNEMLFRLKEMEYVEKIAERVGEISLSGNGNVLSQFKELFKS